MWFSTSQLWIWVGGLKKGDKVSVLGDSDFCLFSFSYYLLLLYFSIELGKRNKKGKGGAMCWVHQLSDWQAIWTNRVPQMSWSHSWLHTLPWVRGREMLKPFDSQGTCGWGQDEECFKRTSWKGLPKPSQCAEKIGQFGLYALHLQKQNVRWLIPYKAKFVTSCVKVRNFLPLDHTQWVWTCHFYWEVW